MDKFIVRISNEIGNQMFMYASTFAIAKKLNRSLYIDDETAFLARKNISKYALNNFNLSTQTAVKKDKFIGIFGYIKRKILKKINPFLRKKVFYIEPKNFDKITNFDEKIFNITLAHKTYLEGYFETEKYFKDLKEVILNEFSFIDAMTFKKNRFYNELIKKNSVSICLRQNRFIEGKNPKNYDLINLSNQFRDEQIKYINKSIDYIKKKVDHPTFYLWSNDLDNIDMSQFKSDITKIYHNDDQINIDKRALDLFLISQCNHHITIPSSFNWWGAWLSSSKNGIICRPDDNFFSNFHVNNKDFWPNNWIKIS